MIARTERGSLPPTETLPFYSVTLQSRDRVGLEPLVLGVTKDVWDELHIGSAVDVVVVPVRP